MSNLIKDASKNQEVFTRIYEAYIKREGSDKLLDWIKSSDFFQAPASTRFHLSEPGGLAFHSINVCERLLALCSAESEYNSYFKTLNNETIAICGLLHDVCKIGVYKTELRNRKNDAGQWEKYEAYTFDDPVPYGHGEKSVYIISSFMKLTREEAMAIRWHMAAWNDGEKQNAGNAFGKYPLAVLTHIADLQATYLSEA